MGPNEGGKSNFTVVLDKSPTGRIHNRTGILDYYESDWALGYLFRNIHTDDPGEPTLDITAEILESENVEAGGLISNRHFSFQGFLNPGNR